MSEAKETELKDGEVQFFDYYLPSLGAGFYDVAIKTAIEGVESGEYFKNPITQRFEVRAPQFHIAASEVHGVYPPNNSNANYSKVLPHIIFHKRLLPWERPIGSEAEKRTPWLALLIFKEGEITIDPSTNSSLKGMSVEEFFKDDGDVIKPVINFDSLSIDVRQSQCQSIRISAGAFKALTPRQADLPYLAHVRQVNTVSQANSNDEDRGWFSVVVGNRLLAADKSASRYYVHLVSLEGFWDYLVDNPKIDPKASDATQEKDFQLISLYNWSFVSQAQAGESFAELATNLVTQACNDPANLLLRRQMSPQNADAWTTALKRVQDGDTALTYQTPSGEERFAELATTLVRQAGGDPGNLLLQRQVSQPPNPEAWTTALKRVRDGYTALTYQTPSGEESFAWYRGPLTPVVAQPLPRPSADYHYPSASAAMIYDQHNGIFDQSYATAWTIGRMLALADGKFAQMLSAYRRRFYQLLGRLVDHKNVDKISDDDLRAALQSNVRRNAFNQISVINLGKKVTDTLRNNVAANSGAIQARHQVPITANPVMLIKDYLLMPNVQSAIKDNQEQQSLLKTIVNWLEHKQLLYDVPFNHLVPDQFMLPVESLRFFYIDQNWLDALTDGALSIGIQSSKDAIITRAVCGTIKADSTKKAKSGILIRSALVAGWPGLVVKAYKSDRPLKTRRMDRLSANVLLCLFKDIPDTVTLSEPAQGLRFGVEDDDTIPLRELSDKSETPIGKSIPGKKFPKDKGFTQFYRAPVDDAVLEINKIVEEMQKEKYLGKNVKIGAAAFAIEMVKAPEQLKLSFNPPTPQSGGG